MPVRFNRCRRGFVPRRRAAAGTSACARSRPVARWDRRRAGRDGRPAPRGRRRVGRPAHPCPDGRWRCAGSVSLPRTRHGPAGRSGADRAGAGSGRRRGAAQVAREAAKSVVGVGAVSVPPASRGWSTLSRCSCASALQASPWRGGPPDDARLWTGSGSCRGFCDALAGHGRALSLMSTAPESGRPPSAGGVRGRRRAPGTVGPSCPVVLRYTLLGPLPGGSCWMRGPGAGGPGGRHTRVGTRVGTSGPCPVLISRTTVRTWASTS